MNKHEAYIRLFQLRDALELGLGELAGLNDEQRRKQYAEALKTALQTMMDATPSLRTPLHRAHGLPYDYLLPDQRQARRKPADSAAATVSA